LLSLNKYGIGLKLNQSKSFKLSNTIQTIVENDEKYVGEVLNGKKHGHGTLTKTHQESASEMSYVGEWKDDKQNGSGTMKIIGIAVIVILMNLLNSEESLLDDPEPEFIEVLKTAKCTIMGQFQNGEPHGEIDMKVEVTKDDEKRTMFEYAGMVREGKVDGKGTFSYPDSKYKGEFKNGKKHG
jgi:hypothetical protein